LHFSFGEYNTEVIITREIPQINVIAENFLNSIIIADKNTAYIAEKIRGIHNIPLCILESGEENKNWQSAEKILECAHNKKLGRDGLFLAAGGGVIGDLSGFAASIYKRGCRFALISTTLLGMTDASVGGKTGFDLFDIKNLIGTFYPAEKVFIPADVLITLPQNEWKSGMAELLKTAILSGSGELMDLISANREDLKQFNSEKIDLLLKLIEKAVLFKGCIVSEDPKETGSKRILLNLGHTFGHALESTAGLGKISHGEAVAWGMVRACDLGSSVGITPKERAAEIKELIASFGYSCVYPAELSGNADMLFNAMKNDKKNKSNSLRFIVPDAKGACPVTFDSEKETKLIINILKGGIAQ